eukprot:jgi/Chrpa1/5207/Chrysochromulina_OHIO_Genome00002622-RA
MTSDCPIWQVALSHKLEAIVAEEKSFEAKRREALKQAQREYSRPFSARPPLALPGAHEAGPSPQRPSSSPQHAHAERFVRPQLRDGSGQIIPA